MFAKRLIQLLEKNQLTVSESLSMTYAILLSNVDHDKSHYNFSYLSYVLSNRQIISLQESNCMVVDGTTGLKSWTAAKHLANWIDINKDLVENKSILELGSGIGLTGIVILKTCSPSLFTFSDHHSKVLEVLRNNISTNDVKQKSKVYQIDWSDSYCLDNYLNDNNPDVIIAADVVFDPLITSYLCEVLNKLLVDSNKSRVCYIACTLRSDQTIEHFCKLIVEEYNLKLENICDNNSSDDLSSFYYDSLNTKSSIFKITT